MSAMNRVEELKVLIEAAQDEIREIQDECSHPKAAVKKKAGASTGNYLSADMYWYDCHCTLCDKRWSEDQ